MPNHNPVVDSKPEAVVASGAAVLLASKENPMSKLNMYSYQISHSLMTLQQTL